MSDSTTCLRALQDAVYDALVADSALLTLLGRTADDPGVYDAVPDNTGYPYVVIAELDERQHDTMRTPGRKAVVTLVTLSDYAGYDILHQIHARIVAVLDRTHLTVTGWSTDAGVYLGAKLTRLLDGKGREIRTGRPEFEFILKQVIA